MAAALFSLFQLERPTVVPVAAVYVPFWVNLATRLLCSQIVNKDQLFVRTDQPNILVDVRLELFTYAVNVIFFIICLRNGITYSHWVRCDVLLGLREVRGSSSCLRLLVFLQRICLAKDLHVDCLVLYLLRPIRLRQNIAIDDPK